jgi:hypothetical protein
MFRALTLLLTLVVVGQLPAQTGSLKIGPVRSTYGLLGLIRSDAKVLPGDAVFFEFDIEGITVAPDGKVQYGMSLEAIDPKGKVLFKQNPQEQETLATLGGKIVPAFAHLDIGLEQPPGEYTVKVTVMDRANKATQSFSHKLNVLPAEFGIVRVKTTSDPNGNLPSPIVAAGETVWLNFAAVRFGRDKGKEQPHVAFEMRILDEAGKPTLSKPHVGVINADVPPTEKLIGGQFQVAANRPGKFTIELAAEDKVTGKTALVKLPLLVQPRR